MINFMLAIDPVAFHLFGLPVRWYALCILAGALLCLFVCQAQLKSYGYGKEILSDMFLYALISGLVGTRIWYVIANFQEFISAGNIFEIVFKMISVWDGGLAVQGGVILGVLGGLWYLFKHYPDSHKYPKTFFADIVIPNILIAQVVGRWGNFFNQEVYGDCQPLSNWEWLPTFITDQMAVCTSSSEIAVPLFLIEGACNLVGWFLISIIIRYFVRKRYNGQLACCYFIWYGIVRLVLEPLRDSSFIMQVSEGSFPTTLVMSAIFVIVGIVSLIALKYLANVKINEGEVDDADKLLKNSILTLTVAKGYYAVKTAKYLSKGTNNNYQYDCYMLAVCPFYWFKWYKKYGELCYQELVSRQIEVEDFREELKKKAYIPFMPSVFMVKYMNMLYEDDAKHVEN